MSQFTDFEKSCASSYTFERTLGVGSIVFMVVAAAAPLTVVGGTVPLVFATSESLGVPAYYLIAAVTLAVFSAGFTAMSSHVKNAGAFYSYVHAGLGKVPGVGSAILALFSYSVLLVAVYAYCGEAVKNAVSHYFHADAPWWIWTASIAILISFLGYHSINLSSKVLGILLLAEVAVVVIVDVAIAVQKGAEGLSATPFSISAIAEGSPGIGLMFAFFGFIGFEATAVFREETKDPDKSIPKATYIAVILIGSFYSLSSWAIAMGAGVVDIVSSSVADPEGLVIALAGQYVFPVLGDVVQILLVTSLFACVLAFHNVVTRYQYSLGGQGILFSRLGSIHEKNNSPAYSSMVTSFTSVIALSAVVVIGLDPVSQIYSWFSGAATLGLLILMALTSLSVCVFFWKKKLGNSRVRTLYAPLLSLLVLVLVIGLVVLNFPMLVGDTATATVMATAVVVSFFVGIVMAVRLQRRRPDVLRKMDESLFGVGDSASDLVGEQVV